MGGIRDQIADDYASLVRRFGLRESWSLDQEKDSHVSEGERSRASLEAVLCPHIQTEYVVSVYACSIHTP